MSTETPQPANPKKSAKRRGVVIVAVVVVIVLLSLAGYHYSDVATSEYKAAEYSHRLLQARAFAQSGVHYTAGILGNLENYELHGGNWQNNPELFRDIPIKGADGKIIGRFTIICAPDPEMGGSEPYYGVTCESGKINLNAMMKIDPTGDLLYKMLLGAGVAEEIAACIVDWLDADTDPRAGGAEDDYYAGQSPPYRARNGAIDSIEELLLVKGVTEAILYGGDVNRNGVQDEGETSGEGGFSRGLASFLTVHSRSVNRDALGLPQQYVNVEDPATLDQLLAPLSEVIDPEVAAFAIAYRKMRPTNVIKSAFHLADEKQLEIRIPGKREPNIIPNPLKDNPAKQRELLPLLYEKATLKDPSSVPEIPAQINLATAPREVLMGLVAAVDGGITEADVDSILNARANADLASELYQTPTWLLTEANIKASSLRKLEEIPDPVDSTVRYSLLTGRSTVFRFQSIGYFEGRGPTVRLEVVIDTNPGGKGPRIVSWRDLTELGKGWEPSKEMTVSK